MVPRFFSVQKKEAAFLLRLQSADGLNRLTRECVLSLTEEVRRLAGENRAVILAGSDRFFSVGAELEEISALNGPTAYEFSKVGQALMQAIDCFPAPVYASIAGYCMGGGFDLALACDYRIASPQAVFGHRGAALGLITGWGGTQRLPRWWAEGELWKC
jgi:enoyl-CoA hydratase